MKKLIMVLLVLFVVQGVFAEWTVEESEDLMSGTTNVFLANEADVSQGTLQDPVIAIRHDENEHLELLIHWGGYSVDDHGVVVATVGDPKENEAEVWDVTLSTAREVTFIDDSTDFINGLIFEERLVVMTRSATGRDMVGLWDISGLEDVIDVMK